MNIKCREYQLILQMIAVEINSTNNLPEFGKKNYALQKREIY